MDTPCCQTADSRSSIAMSEANSLVAISFCRDVAVGIIAPNIQPIRRDFHG